MAKHCEACKQEYSDDLASCPHCGARSQTGSKENIDLEQLGAAGVSGEPGTGSKASILRRATQTQVPPGAETQHSAPTGRPPDAGGIPGTAMPSGPAMAVEGAGEVQRTPKVTKIATRQPGLTQLAGPGEGGRKPETQLIRPEEGSGKKKRTDVVLSGEAGRPKTDPQVDVPTDAQAGADEDVGFEEVMSGADSGGQVSEPVSSIPEMDLDELIRTEQMMAESSAVDLGSDPEVFVADPSSEVDLMPGQQRGRRRTADDEPAEVSAEDLEAGEAVEGIEEVGEPASGTSAVEAVEVFDDAEANEAPTVHHSGEGFEELGFDDADEEQTAVVAPDLAPARPEDSGSTEATTLHAGTDDLAAELLAHDEAADEVAAEDLAEQEPVEELGAEEVGAEEVSDEDIELPAKPAAKSRGEKVRKLIPAGGMLSWVGGGAIGAVAASILFIILIATGLVGGSKEKTVPQQRLTGGGGAGPGPQAAQPQQDPFREGVGRIGNGDYEGALKVFENVQPTPENMAARGEAKWLSYLQRQKKANAPLKDSDPEVVDAKAMLDKSGNATARFWLGQIEEATGHDAEARKAYEEGLKNFPDAKWMFRSALDRLDARHEAGAAAGARLTPGDAEAEGIVQLTLYLVALQAPAPANEPAAQEAGAKFWEALRLANKEHKYSDAVTALREAMKTHEARRFLRLDKAQNPVTDRYEDIFLRSGDELIAYWDMLAKLTSIDPKLARQDPAKAIDQLIKAKSDADELLKATATPLVEAKLVPANDYKTLPAGIAKLIQDKTKADDDRKTADEALASAANLLKAEKLANDDPPAKSVPAGVKKAVEELKTADAKLQGVSKELAAAGVKDADPAKGVQELAGVKNDLDQVAKKLEPKYVDPKANVLDPAGRKAVLAGVDQLIKSGGFPVGTALSEMALGLTRLGGGAAEGAARGYGLLSRLADGMAQTADYETRLQQARTPQQMVDLWPAVLQEERGRKDVAVIAAKDGADVAADGRADPEVRARGRYVEGLALRNTGKYEAARKALGEAIASSAKGEGWKADAREALKELTDPAAYYLARPRWLLAEGRDPQALAIVKEGLDPQLFANNGRLLALRSLIHLDAARRQAKDDKLSADNPNVKEALADAQAAVKAGIDAKDALAEADGHYAAGRIAEEMENWSEAQKHYDGALAAVKKAGDSADQKQASGRYQVALARVLLRIRQGAPLKADGARPEAPRVGRRRGDRGLLVASAGILARADLLIPDPCCPLCDVPAAVYPVPCVRELPVSGAETGPQRGTTEETQRRASEAVRLANSAIAAGNREAYLVKALALARQEDWTEALRTYLKGLEELVRPPRYPENYVHYLNGLRYLIDNNPAFRPTTGVLASQQRPAPEVVEATTQAIRLADEAIAAGNPEGYFTKGLALAKRGQWKDGLRVYIEGLEHVFRPARYGRELQYLVANHPAFQRPDSLYPPNDVAANRRFVAGVDAYWACDYAGAERELLQAIHNSGQDARYYYYLGLARLALPGKRGQAYDDFRMAGLLERGNRPNSVLVGRTLERVQGPARVLLNDKAGRVPPRPERTLP
jgi:hypothetical protein